MNSFQAKLANRIDVLKTACTHFSCLLAAQVRHDHRALRCGGLRTTINNTFFEGRRKARVLIRWIFPLSFLIVRSVTMLSAIATIHL